MPKGEYTLQRYNKPPTIIVSSEECCSNEQLSKWLDKAVDHIHLLEEQFPKYCVVQLEIDENANPVYVTFLETLTSAKGASISLGVMSEDEMMTDVEEVSNLKIVNKSFKELM